MSIIVTIVIACALFGGWKYFSKVQRERQVSLAQERKEQKRREDIAELKVAIRLAEERLQKLGCQSEPKKIGEARIQYSKTYTFYIAGLGIDKEEVTLETKVVPSFLITDKNGTEVDFPPAVPMMLYDLAKKREGLKELESPTTGYILVNRSGRDITKLVPHALYNNQLYVLAENSMIRRQELGDDFKIISEGGITEATVEEKSQSDVSQSPRDLKLLSAHTFLTKNAPEFQIHYESEEDSDGREEWIWLQYKNGDLRVRIYLALGRLCMEATLLSSHGEPASALHNELTKEYMKGAKTSGWMNHYGLGGNECEIGFMHKKNFGDDFNEENLWQVVEVSLRELVEYRSRLDELERQ